MGLGTIGIELTEYLAEKGFMVIAHNWWNLDEKKQRFECNLEKKAKFEKVGLASLEMVKARVFFTYAYSSLSECPVIIDASVEDYSAKKEIYTEILDVCPGRILATTTSSLDIKKLAEYYETGLFVGLHFLNPPTKMKLIELSCLLETHQRTKEIINELVRRFDDKCIIEMPPLQGYIVNRLLFLYMNAAFRMMENNNIDCSTIDNAMKFGANMPIGPCELSDYIGNDITLDILNYFHEAFGDEAYAPSDTIVSKVAKGEFGRETHIGSYRY